MLSIHSPGLCSVILNSKDAIPFQCNVSLDVPSAVLFRPALLCPLFMIRPAPQPSQPIVHLTRGVHFLVESQIKYWLQVPSAERAMDWQLSSCSMQGRGHSSDAAGIRFHFQGGKRGQASESTDTDFTVVPCCKFWKCMRYIFFFLLFFFLNN